MSTIYSTLDELVEREIVPALGEYADKFDVDGIVSDLRERELIRWVGERQGFELVADEYGDTPGFWEIVHERDYILSVEFSAEREECTVHTSGAVGAEPAAERTAAEYFAGHKVAGDPFLSRRVSRDGRLSFIFRVAGAGGTVPVDAITDTSRGVFALTGPCSMSSPCPGDSCPEHGRSESE